MSRKTARRPRAETAELVRQSAVRLLQERGLRGFANSVRLDDALHLLEQEQGIRLTHGSIYGRIWDDQRDFQLDVVATTIARYDGAEIAAAIAAARPGEHETAPPIVVAFDRAVAAARASRSWNLWLGARTAVVSTPEEDDDDRLGAGLEAARRQVVDTIADALAALAVIDPAPDETERAGRFVTLLIGASLDSGPVDHHTVTAALGSGAAAPGTAPG